MIFDEKYKMINGYEIPVIALGTWQIPDDKVSDIVKSAIDIGYRHIDTAQDYENERGVGEAVRNCKIPRSEIFVTSKVLAELKTYEEASESIEKSLETMKLDYIDLMLIHAPQPWKEYGSEERYFKENREVWKALEDAYKSGKVKAIGVSNFLVEDLENILCSCEIRPMVNQFKTHISETPLNLIDFCRKNSIIMESYSPMAHGNILNNKDIMAIAEKYSVSVAQLCIKYTHQLGMVTLPKASDKGHIKENSELDFEISEEDMEFLKYFNADEEKNIDFSELDNIERRNREFAYIADDACFDQSKEVRRKNYYFNNVSPWDFDALNRQIRKTFGKTGKNCIVFPPFHCDLGFNIEVGDNFFANYNFTALDVGKIIIGDNVFIAPNVSIYTAGHPIHPDARNSMYEYGIEVKIGSDCWIGGSSVICPGVTIGDGVVIGAGSVVTKDIPSGVVAAGNPCRVIRKITDDDMKYYFKDRKFDNYAMKYILKSRKRKA